MPKIRIEGGRRLSGAVSLQGAKNSALPILAASFLTNAPCIIHNCPRLSDVETSFSILRELGCAVQAEEGSVMVDASRAEGFEISDILMREMRSSIIFLGAIIGKVGRARLSSPGGCEAVWCRKPAQAERTGGAARKDCKFC